MLSLGASLDETDKTDFKHMKFVLSLNGYSFQTLATNVVNATVTAIDFDYYEREWANETLMVNGVKYKNALQRLKTVIHSV